MRHIGHRLSAMLAVIALLLTACGGGSGSSDDALTTTGEDDTEVAETVEGDPAVGTAEDDTQPAATVDAQEDDGVSDEERWMETPLAQYMGWGQSVEDDQAFWQEQDRLRQEYVATCMAEQGFEYVPVDYSQFEEFYGVDPFEGLSEEERIDKFGFGMSTMFEFEQEMMGGPEPEFIDPNWETYETLSQAEQEAWDRALYGEPVEWDENDPRFDPASEEFDPELMMPRGCFGDAERELGTFDQQEAWMELEPEFMALYQRIENDPRLVAASREWSSCMAEGGFVFGSQEDIWRELEERMMPIWESQDPFAGMSEQDIEAMMEAMTPQEQQAYFQEHSGIPPEMQDQLAEVQEYELGLARADFDCQKNAGLEDIRFEIQVEYEQEFIEEHGAELSAIREAEAR